MVKTQSIDDGVLAELRKWGGPAEMSAFEALMWLAEVDPRLRSTTTSVLTLDLEPDWERFLADHQWLVDAVPRLFARSGCRCRPSGWSAIRPGSMTPNFELSTTTCAGMRLPGGGSGATALRPAADDPGDDAVRQGARTLGGDAGRRP